MTKSLFDYYTDEEKSKLGIKTEKITERNDIEYNDKQLNNSNGIIEVKYGNEIYRTWTVDFIRPIIINHLKKLYINSLIVRELNDIDLTILNNQSQLPVEIQKSTMAKQQSGKWCFSHTQFESYIRTQLDINIETYGKCLFFMDSEYLRYLQSGIVRKTLSINMTWLVKLMREGTLKVFTIKYDGVVTELSTKDFDFLKDVSQMYTTDNDNDERILNRNKLKIFNIIIREHNFIQDEINQFENKRYKIKDNIEIDNDRCDVYESIISAINQLSNTNKCLSCNVEEKPYVSHGVTLGLFKQNDFNGHSKYARIQFVDKFNVAQYFPGYIKNKEIWDYCKIKQRSFSMSEFNGIINGTFNYEFLKKQSTMLDY